MKIHIDNEALFKERMSTGINLFTGSGFSTLPYDGKALPTGKELCPKLCKIFDISTTYGNDLETISTLAPKQAYQSYLREKFTATGCHNLYTNLNKINIHSFITTNIDNIVHHAIGSGDRYFLKSITYYGASRASKNKLEYLPLHGDVTNNNFPLYFGKFDLAVVDEVNNELFSAMHIKMLDAPTLFWGYGFHDSGVLKVVSRVLGRKAQDIWVQCMPDDENRIKLFRDVNCNVIIADTKKLLEWISVNLDNPTDGGSNDSTLAPELNKYSIPTIGSIESLPAAEYFIKGMTHWYPILTNQAYETSIVNFIYNKALSNKVVIIVGSNFTGKTTLLMQLALKIEGNKIFIPDAISKEEATFIGNKIGDIQTWIFLSQGTLDIEALSVFTSKNNIRIIGTAEDYSYESSRHLLTQIPHERIEMGEIERREAELIFEHIPPALRKNEFRYKSYASEKYSMLELILKNVRDVLSRERIAGILSDIKVKNITALKVLALASYLSSNDSALSTDILFSFFKLKTYNEAKSLIRTVNSLLAPHKSNLSTYDDDQDYYILRSKLFSIHANESFKYNINLKDIYANVVKEFIFNVSIFKIYNYHIFRRKAYDAGVFTDLFGEGGEEIYDYLYEHYSSPYTLQQKALYLGKLGKYEEAFSFINQALGYLPNNFSMKNSEAILLFEANKMKKTDLAIAKMMEAMGMLENCYNSDKRKVYHAQKYAEFSLLLSSEYNQNDYLPKAKKWIDEIIEKKDSLSRKTLELQNELKFRIC